MSKRIEELEKEIRMIELAIIDMKCQAEVMKEEYTETEYDEQLRYFQGRLEERKLAEEDFLEIIDNLRYYASTEAEPEINEFKKLLKKEVLGE